MTPESVLLNTVPGDPSWHASSAWHRVRRPMSLTPRLPYTASCNDHLPRHEGRNEAETPWPGRAGVFLDRPLAYPEGEGDAPGRNGGRVQQRGAHGGTGWEWSPEEHPRRVGPVATTLTATGRRGRRAVTGGLGLSSGERETADKSRQWCHLQQHRWTERLSDQVKSDKKRLNIHTTAYQTDMPTV